MTWRSWLGLAALLVIYYVMGVTAASDKSPTFDEPLHMVGGYTYWKLNDYRTQPENGMLPQRLAGLPLTMMGLKLGTPMDHPDWLRGYTLSTAERFVDTPGNPTQAMVNAGRRAMALAGAALVAVVFFWARSLWGVMGGWFAAVAAAFGPTMLAHGPMCTSDLMAALFFTVTIILAWRAFHVATIGNVLGTGAAIGALFLSKMSAPLVLIVLVGMIGVRFFFGPAMAVRWRARTIKVRGRLRSAAWCAALFLIWGAITWGMIWAAFGFRFSPFAPGMAPATMPIPWSEFLSTGMATVKAARWASEHRLLPEAYLWGSAFVFAFSGARGSFFLGTYNLTGEVAYFPFVFLAKTPIATLLLMGLGTAAVIALSFGGLAKKFGFRGGAKRWIYPITPMLLMGAVYWIASLLSHLNIGHRHLLPIYPLVYVLAGAAGCWVAAAKRSNAPQTGAAKAWGAAAVLLLGLLVVESVLARPNYLAYFNGFVGGTKQGYRYVIDSNDDWGQELPALRKYLEARGVRPDGSGTPAYFAYFGLTAPQVYGVPGVELGSYTNARQPPVPFPLGPGIYCISATILQGVSVSGFGPWDKEREAEYQRLMHQVQIFWRRDSSPEYHSAFELLLRNVGDEGWGRSLARYGDLRIDRLCAFLRGKTPDDNINGSILVFNLSSNELAAALDSPPRELRERNLMTERIESRIEEMKRVPGAR